MRTGYFAALGFATFQQAYAKVLRPSQQLPGPGDTWVLTNQTCAIVSIE